MEKCHWQFGYYSRVENRTIFIWSVAGFLTIAILGSLLHFVFEWSGNAIPVALIAPVNESVWEHLKLGYWSLILFTVFEHASLRGQVSNYFFSKAVGITIMSLTILIIFYSYTAVVERSILWIDIGSYFFGAAICQMTVFKMFTSKRLPGHLEVFGKLVLVVYAFLLMLFTFYPPSFGIFEDGRNGTYGLEQYYK